MVATGEEGGARWIRVFQRLGYSAHTQVVPAPLGAKLLRPLRVSINFVMLFGIFWFPQQIRPPGPFSANFKTFADFGQISKTMWYFVISIFSVLD